MQIRKESPNWLIIGDTKPNQQSFQKYADSVTTDFETTWIRANGKAQQVSPAEKMLELLVCDIAGIKNNKSLPNNEFVSKNFQLFEPLFNHFMVTIVFNEVSSLFLQNILMEQYGCFISQKKYSDLSLWLPPAFEHPVISSTYGTLIGDIASKIEEFIKEASNKNVSKEESIKTAMTMAPLAQHMKLIMTASIGSWRKILLDLAEFEKDIETRYVALHLCRDLKMRYMSFFCDFALVTKEGKYFGLDSINNDGFWKISKLGKKL